MTWMVSRANRDPNGRPIPGPPAYSPEWVAACYGVKVTDPCPRVRIDFPTEPLTATVAEHNRGHIQHGPA